MGRVNIFLYSLALFFKSKKIINVNVATLAQMTFPDALSFSILGERCRSLSLFLSHIEKAKPQRRDSLAPSFGGKKK